MQRHSQQQVALAALGQSHWKLRDNQHKLPQPAEAAMPTETPRDGPRKPRDLLQEELNCALEANLAMRADFAALQMQFNNINMEVRLKQGEMWSLLESQKRDDIQKILGESLKEDAAASKLNQIANTLQAQNWLLREQVATLKTDLDLSQKRVATLEQHKRTLEDQNLALTFRNRNPTPPTPHSFTRQSTAGSLFEGQTPRASWTLEPEGPGFERQLSVPGIEKFDHQGGSSNSLLNEIQSRPNTREIYKTDSGASGFGGKEFRHLAEKLTRQMEDLKAQLGTVYQRVDSFSTDPPFEVTNPGGAALRKLNKSVSKITDASNSVEKVAEKLAKVESSITKLSSSNILKTLQDNSNAQRTSIFEVSDALQNMEGKFDLLVKNVVHKVEDIGTLIRSTNLRNEGEGQSAEGNHTQPDHTKEIGQILHALGSYKQELFSLRTGLQKMDQVIGSVATNQERAQTMRAMERAQGESTIQVCGSEMKDLRRSLKSLRRQVTETTVVPIKAAVEDLLDRIAETSTYMVELKLEAFNRANNLPVTVKKVPGGAPPIEQFQVQAPEEKKPTLLSRIIAMTPRRPAGSAES